LSRPLLYSLQKAAAASGTPSSTAAAAAADEIESPKWEVKIQKSQEIF